MATTNPLLYTASTHTACGRDGGAYCSSDGRLVVKLSLPNAPGNGSISEELRSAFDRSANDLKV